MPNYCENDLTVVGLKETLDELLIYIQGDDEVVLDFARIVPEPEGISNGEYFSPGGHEWRVENWGTKWNAIDVTLERTSPERAILSFRTAWSPPTPVIEQLVNMFADLRVVHQYYEYGAGYQGHDEWHLGSQVIHDIRPYDGPRGG